MPTDAKSSALIRSRSSISLHYFILDTRTQLAIYIAHTTKGWFGVRVDRRFQVSLVNLASHVMNPHISAPRTNSCLTSRTWKIFYFWTYIFIYFILSSHLSLSGIPFIFLYFMYNIKHFSNSKCLQENPRLRKQVTNCEINPLSLRSYHSPPLMKIAIVRKALVFRFLPRVDGLPGACTRMLSPSLTFLPSLFLRVCEVHVLFPLLGRHAAPQLAGGPRHHGDRFLRLLAAQLQEENDERVRRSRTDAITLAEVPRARAGRRSAVSAHGPSTSSGICATWKGKLQSTFMRASLCSCALCLANDQRASTSAPWVAKWIVLVPRKGNSSWEKRLHKIEKDQRELTLREELSKRFSRGRKSRESQTTAPRSPTSRPWSSCLLALIEPRSVIRQRLPYLPWPSVFRSFWVLGGRVEFAFPILRCANFASYDGIVPDCLDWGNVTWQFTIFTGSNR